MPFWSTNFRAEGAPLKDPKRNFRFKVEFDGIEGDSGALAWYAKSVTKPSFTVENVEHAYLNHKFY